MRQIYKFGLNPPRFLKISFTFPAKLHFKSSGRLPAILQRPFPTWETFLQLCSASSRFGKASRNFAAALPDSGNLLAILRRPFRDPGNPLAILRRPFRDLGNHPAILQQAFRILGNPPAVLQQAFRDPGNPLAILRRPFRSS